MPVLGDICTIIVDSEHKTAPKSEAGHPMIRTPDIGLGRLNLDRAQRVDEETYQQWTRRAVPEPGDLILAREAPVGHVGIVLPGMEPCLGQRTVLLRPDRSKVDPHYLNFLLSGPELRGRMDALSNGATVPHLNMKDIRALTLPELPGRDVQVRVASVLSTYDELIENNARRIQILEEMAQAIYREWFVEFRYPDHEDVPLVDSDLGPIPEGWRVVAVSDVATMVRGRSYRKDEIPESGGVPFLNLKCMERGGGFRKSGLKRYTGKFKPSQEARPGDIVIAVTDMTQERNVVARAARVPTLGEEFGVISLDLARIVPYDLESTFLYGMFRYSEFSEVVKNFANGANVLHLSPDRIAEHRFVRPAPVVEQDFVERVEPMYQLIDQLQLQNENLRTTRDLLLPRLISGEIDVSDLDLNLDLGDAAA